MSIFRKQKPQTEPNTLLLIGKPKVGKTTVCSTIPNSVIIDYEKGTNFIEHSAIFDAHEVAKEDWRLLKNSGFRYGIIDSATSMENFLCRQIVAEENKRIKKTNALTKQQLPLVSDISEMAYGKGYGLLREATLKHLEFLQSCFERLIIIGHSKDKQIASDQIALDLDLTGKNAPIFMSKIDCIGFLYREKSKLMLSFETTVDYIGGSRIDRFDGKKFTISEKTEKGITTYWDSIYDLSVIGKDENKQETKEKEND